MIPYFPRCVETHSIDSRQWIVGDTQARPSVLSDTLVRQLHIRWLYYVHVFIFAFLIITCYVCGAYYGQLYTKSSQPAAVHASPT